jgi:ankyrin repeat protein
MGYSYNESCFVDSAKKGGIKAVKLFLDEETDINAANQRGQTALIQAAGFQRKEVITLLLERGADLEHIGERHARTAMGEAASAGNTEVVQILKDAGAKK